MRSMRGASAASRWVPQADPVDRDQAVRGAQADGADGGIDPQSPRPRRHAAGDLVHHRLIAPALAIIPGARSILGDRERRGELRGQEEPETGGQKSRGERRAAGPTAHRPPPACTASTKPAERSRT